MKYCRKEEVVARSVAGANLLVPIHDCTRSVYTLNATGCRLWEWMGSPRTEEELAESLAEHYHIPGVTAQHDVHAFLDDMVQMGLAEERA
mgnify:CR=1 FL=1